MAGSEDEDKSQKTEDPTPHRLEEAFKKGQVAFSREITHWFMLGGVFLSVLLIAPFMLRRCRDLFLPFIQSPHLLTMQYTNLGDVGEFVLFGFLKIMSLPFGVMIISALCSGFLQTRFSISAEAFFPKLERISPFKGFGRLFSLKSLVEFLKGLTKLTVISVAIYIVLSNSLRDIGAWMDDDPAHFFTRSQNLTLLILGVILVILFLIAGLDYGYQKFDFLKGLRMSPEDIKKEMKEIDGDPLIKQRMRRLREAKLQQSLMASVPKATAIITNPTHFAVAIDYTEGMNAPVVVAKGQDLLALKIREIATLHKVPIFEDPPLARSLHSSVEVGNEIPTDHYDAVAKIIRLVMSMKRRYF